MFTIIDPLGKRICLLLSSIMVRYKVVCGYWIASDATTKYTEKAPFRVKIELQSCETFLRVTLVCEEHKFPKFPGEFL